MRAQGDSIKAGTRLTGAQEAKVREETKRLQGGLPATTFGTDLWGSLREMFAGAPGRASAKAKEAEQIGRVNSAVEANRRRRRVAPKVPKGVVRVPTDWTARERFRSGR